jgi:DNA-binding XRE family transcriptional regulator
MSRTSFKEQFLARTAHARETAGFTQEDMAAKLGITQALYSKYETRTPLPHDLVLIFCAMCEVTPGWMYTAVVPVRVKPKRTRRSQKPPRRHGVA